VPASARLVFGTLNFSAAADSLQLFFPLEWDSGGRQIKSLSG
jgi:hypothetical protein